MTTKENIAVSKKLKLTILPENKEVCGFFIELKNDFEDFGSLKSIGFLGKTTTLKITF